MDSKYSPHDRRITSIPPPHSLSLVFRSHLSTQEAHFESREERSSSVERRRRFVGRRVLDYFNVRNEGRQSAATFPELEARSTQEGPESKDREGEESDRERFRHRWTLELVETSRTSFPLFIHILRVLTGKDVYRTLLVNKPHGTSSTLSQFFLSFPSPLRSLPTPSRP